MFKEILVIVLAIVLWYWITRYKETYVVGWDGTLYTVLDTKTKKETADRLATIKKNAWIIVNAIAEKSVPTVEQATLMKERWGRCKLREIGYFDTNVAYVVNKGDEMRVCVRDKKTGLLTDMNTCMHVVCHELAHLLSTAYGHGEEFLDNFNLVTQVAIKKGVYTPQYFASKPEVYCGYTINSGPCDVGMCKL